MKQGVERLGLPEYEKPAEPILPTETLTVQVDGSCVPMKRGWQECKLGTILKDKHHSPANENHPRGFVSEATYIATMGDVYEFEKHMKIVLPQRVPLKERKRPPMPPIVWLADGAPWIWNMQQRLCPSDLLSCTK